MKNLVDKLDATQKMFMSASGKLNNLKANVTHVKNGLREWVKVISDFSLRLLIRTLETNTSTKP